MAKAELKTQPNEQDVQAFLDTIPDDRKRQDSQGILDLMQHEHMRATNP